MTYTAEEVRQEIDDSIHSGGYSGLVAIANAYAADLARRAEGVTDRGRVTDEMVDLGAQGQSDAAPEVCIPFGHGKVVITTGKHNDVPCVYLAPASKPGVVGESAKRENLPLDRRVLGESILTFPTAEQARLVADVLCGKYPASPAGVTDIKAMVNRFLGWRLPDDFAPDDGISFKPGPTQNPPHCWPIGTNLFTAAQAEKMFRYVLAAATSASQGGPQS